MQYSVIVSVCVCCLTTLELLDVQRWYMARLISTQVECHMRFEGIMMASQLKIIVLKISFFSGGEKMFASFQLTNFTKFHPFGELR